MSLITRCPACGTMFKVVPDQLRISEGWVRCGHCAEVFDANATMHREDAPAPAPLEPTSPEPPLAVPAPAPASGGPDSSWASEFPSSIHSEVDEPLSPGDPDERELAEEAAVLTRTDLDEPFVVVPGPDPYSPRISRPAPLEPEREPELHDLSFVRKARRKEFWRSPAARAGLVLLALVLAATALAQYGVQERDRLAAVDPSLRPLFSRLCDMFGCTIGSPKQIDAISIDASQFTRLRGDAYRLSVTLRNQAPMPVAMPALELTLTDAQDQPVVRRVLMPAELAPGAATLSASSEWTGSLGLAVATGNLAGRVAGYRVLAFYP